MYKSVFYVSVFGLDLNDGSCRVLPGLDRLKSLVVLLDLIRLL